MAMMAEDGDSIIRRIAENPDYEGAAKRAIQLVAGDLNSNSAQFLFELLQNADDNSYPRGTEPTYTLAYGKDGFLQHCNENGLTPDDVAAICDLGSSTKRGSDTTTGEKGIGFKSVFRVAETVWFASGLFRFTLSREDPFRPRFFADSCFPDGSSTSQTGTSMFLEIDQRRAADVRHAITSVDPASIVFLRRLRRINIVLDSVPDRTLRRTEEEVQGSTTERPRITHIIISEERADGMEHALLHYKAFTFPVNPSVPRRARRSAADPTMVVALPVDSKFSRIDSRNEKVYATLPVRDYGFKFAIQADFILAASRENIHYDYTWNTELRTATSANLVKTIACIAGMKDTELRYTWPSLLDLPPNHGHFFAPVVDAIRDALKEERVVESEAGDLCRPAQLLRVPSRYRFGGVEMPIPSSDARGHLLSSKYDLNLYDKFLGDIGVSEMDKFKLWQHIRDYSDSAVGMEDSVWHGKIAKLIMDSESGLRGYCTDLRLVPVQRDRSTNRTWVAAGSYSGQIFLSTDFDGPDQNPLPQGIDLLYIPRNEHLDEDRRRLFIEDFKVNDVKLSAQSIVERITRVHADFKRGSTTLTKEDLISHTKFLFKGNHQPPPLLWVFTQSGERELASETFAVPIQVDNMTLPVPVLHQDYTAGEPSGGQKLLEWMSASFGMPLVPRLVTSEDGEVYSLSPEMRFIAERVDSFQFLRLLQRNWLLHYRKWLSNKSPHFKQNIRDDIAATNIRCQDSSTTPLRKAMFPALELDLPNSLVPLPLLPIPKSKSITSQWMFLEELGVRLQPTSQDCIFCLRRLKTRVSDSITEPEPHARQGHVTHTARPIMVQAAAALYQLLGDRAKDYKERGVIREFFMHENLILVPAMGAPSHPTKDVWVSSRQCIWSKPMRLRLHDSFALSSCYSNYFFWFFVTAVGVEDTPSLARLCHEADLLSGEDVGGTLDSLQSLAQILAEMSAQLESRRPLRQEVFELKRCRMLPIRFPNLPDTQGFSKLVAASNDDEWFIADRDQFLDGFRDEAPLLAFSGNQLDQIRQLLTVLDVRNRLLSRTADPYSVTDLQRDESYTAFWRSRARFIDRLSPDKPKRLSMRFMTVNAYTTPASAVHWKVRSRDGTWYTGVPKRRVAIATLRGTTLSIYVRKGDAMSNRAQMDLVDDICDMFHIPPHRQLLIYYVLGPDDGSVIDKTLDEKGIPGLPPLAGGEPSSTGESHDEEEEDVLQYNLDSAEPRHAHPPHAAEDPILVEIRGESVPPLKTRKNHPSHVLNTAHPPKTENVPRNEPTISESAGMEATPLAANDGPAQDMPPRAATREKGVRYGPTKGHGPMRIKTPPRASSPAEELVKEAPSFKGIIPEQAFVKRRQATLSQLTPARRLQESSVEELLLQSSLPIQEMAEQISSLPPRPPTPETTDSPANSRSNKNAPAPPSSSAPSKSSEQQRQIAPGPITSLPRRHQSAAAKERDRLAAELDEARLIRERRRLVEQFSGSIEAAGFLRQSGPTNVVFKATLDELPPISAVAAVGDSETAAVLEARLCIPKSRDAERLVYALVPPVVDPTDHDAEFLGQIWVSQLLSNLFGPGVNAADFWKGPLCAKLYRAAGHVPEDDVAPFQVRDLATRRVLARFIEKEILKAFDPWKLGYQWHNGSLTAKSDIKQPPVYYIDVATTDGEGHEPVIMDVFRFDKARRYRGVSGKDRQKHSFVFIRIFNINSTDRQNPPRAAFYIDPWHMYTDGHIEVAACKDQLSVKFTGQPHFFVEHVEPLVFSWTPLPSNTSIRLLRLSSGQRSDRLEGTFEICDLSELGRSLPMYVAISYAWGSSLRPFPLYITEAGNDKPILLPVSLYLALQRIRQWNQPKLLLWADAICIDQTSDLEKETQIPLMSTIFQQALTVFAWLGEENDGSDDAMDLLQKLGDKSLALRRHTEHPETGPTTKMSDYELPQMGVEQRAAVGSIFKRAWFSRMWIIQEAVLAANLILGCGSRTISWETFHASAIMCFMLGRWDPKVAIADERTQKNILHLANLRQNRNTTATGSFFTPSDDTFTLLQLFHQRSVTNPRDRLFALLSMATDGGHEGLRPSYGASEEDVLLRYAAVFVAQGRALDMLYQARVSWDRGALPSWLPRLTAARYPRTLCAWGAEGYRAGGPDSLKPVNEAGITAKLTGSVLTLEGYMVDQIGHMADHASNTGNFLHYLDEIFGAIDEVYGDKPTRVHEGALCRIPLGALHSGSGNGNWDPQEGPVGAYRALREYMATYPEDSWRSQAAMSDVARAGGQGGAAVTDSGLLLRRLWPYVEAAMEFAEAFQPASAVCATTMAGRVALVPVTARLLDPVVIFRGARVPYLLRDSGAGDGTFFAVGECFVDGIMRGELFGNDRSTQLPLRTFQLR